MACLFPLAGYFGKVVNPATGRRRVVFDVRRSFDGLRFAVPCGECIACRLGEARDWAIRCVHENRMHSVSSFITLTYDDKFLPPGGNLDKEAVQLFMKRLRKSRGNGVRYFLCGEYGSETRRPHYHCLLFGVFFADRRRVGESGAGDTLYRSAELGALWPFGQNVIGDVSYKSAAYVAKYCLKKVGAAAPDGRVAEFRLMSRRPGLGAAWLERYHPEAYKSDSVIMDGREVRIPRFYDARFKLLDSDRLDELKWLRRVKALDAFDDNTFARRCVKEKFELRKQGLFARSL